jgi:hypothetical protein
MKVRTTSGTYSTSKNNGANLISALIKMKYEILEVTVD